MTDVEVELAARIARLEALEGIRDLISTYSFHMDHARLDEVAALFTDDCTVDFGIVPVLEGRDALVTFLHAAANADDPNAAMVSTSHHNADVRIELLDDSDARGTVSLYAWHRSGAGDRAEVWGYYFDRFVETDGRWRFAERVLRICGEDGFAAPWEPIDRQLPK